ncbi:hypothetical protein ACS0TY_004621 [Phlomoides rotata]
MGFGLVLYDSLDSHIFTRILVLPGLYSSNEGEAIGLIEVLSWIKELDLQDVLIEMDANLAVD